MAMRIETKPIDECKVNVNIELCNGECGELGFTPCIASTGIKHGAYMGYGLIEISVAFV